MILFYGNSSINIWLEPNQRGGYTVKVLDFGIAKLEMQSEEFNTGIIKTNHSANDVAAAYPSIDDKDPTEIIVGNNSQPVKMGYETFIENVEENAIPKPFNSLTSLMNRT